MNRLITSFLSLSLLLTSCTSSQPKPDSPIPSTKTPPTATPEPDPMQTDWDDRSIFKGGLVESEQHILDELSGASVYRIEFTIADNLYEITGTEEVRYTNTEDVELNEVEFRLFPNILGGEMSISDLTIDGQPLTPEFELENSLMIVRLSAPLEIGQSVVLKMDYAVTVPQSLDLNYGVLAYAEEVLALAHAYPMIAVYDDEGWNAEIPPQDGDVTYADTSFYIVRVHAPKELTLAMSGTRLSLDEDGQAQVLTVANGPARDFYLAASPNYVETSQTFGEVTIRSFASKDAQVGSNFAINVASKSVDVFSKRYAPYPYTELDIVQTPTLALGIEYPGAIAITSRIYDINSEYNGAPASIYMESTVAHEVGHQWFYSLVGDDQLDDPWLDESLTQFVTLQYYADQYGASGENGYRTSLEGRWERIGNADIPIGLPVAGYQGGEYGAIVYGRGPLFFVALRDEMGTDTFDAFIKQYTETLAWGIATPGYLQSLAESHCACQLDNIFEEWVY
ncbi:MAG TPA: M1 family metallopeptidase [Anaerolineales bacterium]|nr:M1 family metallopeptidase [Anaerolineales bacterium]